MARSEMAEAGRGGARAAAEGPATFRRLLRPSGPTKLARLERGQKGKSMTVSLRPAQPADAAPLGRIVFEAFKRINESHGFPPDFPSVEAATGLAGAFIAHPSIYGVVAEQDGTVIGSNFLDERDAVRAVGPITIDPARQAQGVGRLLMEAAIERGKAARSIRLVQDAFNARSLGLYASLGFETKEPLMLMRGKPRGKPDAGVRVRPLVAADIPACAALCEATHGLSRANELGDSLKMFRPFAVERGGRVVGYLASANFWIQNHGMAETEADLKALILGAGAASSEPIEFLFPIRQAGLFRWLLGEGLKIVKPMTLMARGWYQEPRLPWFPTVSY